MDEGGEWLWLLLGEGTSKDFHIWISLFSPKGYQKMVSRTRPKSNNRNRSRGQYPNQRSMQNRVIRKGNLMQNPRKCQTRTLMVLYLRTAV